MAFASGSASNPNVEYSKRLELHLLTVSAKERLHRRAGNSKLAVIVAGLAAAWFSLELHRFSPYWLLFPVAIYAAVAVYHEQMIRGRTRAETAAAYYRRGIARIEDRWAGTGQPGDRFRNEKHVYADDLDIFGSGCLFELLSTARLPMGENRLAQWLSTPSPTAAILERQNLVQELREKLDLREDLAVTGEDLRVRLNPESLTGWAEGAPALPTGAWRGVVVVLAVSAVVTFGYYLSTSVFLPFLIVLMLEGLLLFSLRKRAEAAIAGVACNAEGLVLFSKILQRLEEESFSSPRLHGLVAELKHEGEAASHGVRKLARVVYWVDARESLRIVELPLLLTLQVGFAAEAWRRRWGSRMRKCVEITGEMEALLSLATYSFEHPGDPFPEFVEAIGSEALFDGDELGHPLIPVARCVRNSMRLDKDTRVLLISGSNMSGKSTLLRVAGINTVLAMAGAPIRGKSLRLTPLSIGTCIRRVDSIQEGRSGFYTGILRIRQVFDLVREGPPLLFLFDELLEGTNSKDRRIGAEGLLHALLNRRALGIVTTHDLALTEIIHSLGDSVRNMHFQDFVEAGKMRFDYKLREGVVTKSNAIELMRLIGLEV